MDGYGNLFSSKEHRSAVLITDFWLHQVQQEMRSNCFNNILTALTISDNLHIIFAILEVGRYFLTKYYSYLYSEIYPKTRQQ